MLSLFFKEKNAPTAVTHNQMNICYAISHVNLIVGDGCTYSFLQKKKTEEEIAPVTFCDI